MKDYYKEDEQKDTEVKEKRKENKIIPKMNFAEYILNLRPEWAAALRLYANVKSDLEEKTKEEWDKLFNEMKTRKIKGGR